MEVGVERAWRRMLRRRQRWWRWALLMAILGGWGLPGGVQAAALAPNNDDEIVYLEPDGVIRVHDPFRPNDIVYVAWQSPGGGWTHLQVVDVTGDGDGEIVALGIGEAGPRLTIFDPVARDSDPAGLPTINGVPWTMLYERELPGLPRVLLAGEFDPTRPGVELLYGYQMDPDNDRDRFVLLRQPEGSTQGRVWEQFRAHELDGVWTRAAVGRVGGATDVIALVDNDEGRLEVYRVAPTFTRIFSRVNTGQRWRDVAFGQFNLDGPEELGAVREAELPLATAWVFRYDGTTFVDDYFQALSPGPRRVFFADIGGNGDDELVLLRQVTPELGPRPRLIIRDRGNDTIGMAEVLLDGDNEYQGGASGDLDGDGRDEIVIIRNNRVRYFTEPERSAASVELVVATNRETVVTGNLDLLGTSSTPVLYSPTKRLTAALAPGATSSPRSVRLIDATTSTPLPFTVDLENADWAEVTANANTLPVTLTVTFNARDLQGGSYAGRLVVDAAGENVGNDPWIVDLNLEVNTGVSTQPGSLFFGFDTCAEVAVPRERIVELVGPQGVAYTLSLAGMPEWVMVTPEAGTFPERVLLTVDPTAAPTGISETQLQVGFDLPNAEGLIERATIVIACGTQSLYLPLLKGGGTSE